MLPMIRTDVQYRYQLASRLSERLDEMGKDLSGMIEEINDASSTLNKHNKGDDPVSVFSGPRKRSWTNRLLT